MHCSTDAKKDALEEDANETPVCTMYIVSWFHCSYVIDTYCLGGWSQSGEILLKHQVKIARVRSCGENSGFSHRIKKSNFHVALSKGWGWVLFRLPPSSHPCWDYRLHGTSRELLRGACCVYACISNNGWGQSCNFGDPMTIANQDQSLLEYLAASLAIGP